MKTILDSIHRAAIDQPGTIAIENRAERLSYAELWDDIQDVAGLLSEKQIEVLALYLDNGIEWIVIDLACQLAGVSLVPLPWFFSRQQREHACCDAGVEWIVAEPGLPPDIGGCGAGRLFYRDTEIYQLTASTAAGKQPATGAKISYTSGTTGAPKGIRLAPLFVEQTAVSIAELLRPLGIARHLSVLPYATLLENIAGVYVPLLLGKTVIALPAHQVGLTQNLQLDPARFAQTINASDAGSLIITPQLLEAMCSLAEKSLLDPRRLQFVAVGGARVVTDLLKRAEPAGIPAYEGYGLTEFASVALLNTPWQSRVGSAGKPLPGVSVQFSNEGELLLRRDIGDAAGSHQSIMVSTGDIGHIDADGFVYISGRKSNLIVLATGRNVSPEWIEAELNNSGCIRQSYIFGEAHPHLSALIYADSTVTDEALQDELLRINQQLPAYARVVDWQRLDIPFSIDTGTLTPNGRLRRSIIQQQYQHLIQPQPAARSNPSSLQEINPC